jgi:2-polyprenyl-3-methyl-5-hydroxy-6-metoxy-1,4-benzoquinol methylase
MDKETIIGRIMQRHGARCSLEDFYSTLNVTFHEFESEVYDEAHADMWEALPAQFALLIDDCLDACPDMPQHIRLLDIGCGTGLASDCLFGTAIASRIKSVDLLDISPAMLQRASRRIARHGVPVNPRQGAVDSLPAENRYEFIVACSVLHHIPDLPSFLKAVRQRQPDGGVFLHVHDPNGDYLHDAELRERRARLSKAALPDWVRRLAPGRIIARLRRELTGPNKQDYLFKTNRALLEKGIVATPLSAEEIYSITDIQIHSGGEGISISAIRSWLPDYDCLSLRSYGFFDTVGSSLPAEYRKAEDDLIARRALNGAKVGAAWKVRACPQGTP